MEEDLSVCTSNLMTPLRHISLESSDSRLTTKERLSICCKPAFRLTRIKSKGAILVLVWSYLCTTVLYFCMKRYEDHLKTNGNNCRVKFLVQAGALGLTLSIAGWIADVRFGRYRVISLSIWIMWAAQILATVSSVLVTIVDNYTSDLHSYVNGVLWTIIAIGFGGFQANVIQFGIDQLHDASTNEITSFILWYVWTFYGDGFVMFFILDCLAKQYWILSNLVVCVYLSVALSSMLMFNHWLVKEPATQNPFKLVYSVVRYAIKHKHPEFRSAFTYCEDEPPSRIDFGKSKYGGPFTTEQVEDVKTFLRIILVIFIGTMIFYAIFVSWQQMERMLNLLTDTTSTRNKCYSVEAFVESFFFGSVIILPFYELFLYPIFRRCLEMINSHWKIILGVFLLIAETVVLLVIETVARHNYYLASNSYNTTIPCIGHGTLNNSMDFRLMAVPLLLHSLSTTAIAIGALEFIASQAPYSMRGLIVGMAYCALTLFAAVGLGVSIIPFTKRSFIWGTGIISCGFWYALLLLVVEVLVGFMLIAMQRWYKKRKREDVLPNEHIFAERYYDRDN